MCVLVSEKLGFIFVSHTAVHENKEISLAVVATNQGKGWTARTSSRKIFIIPAAPNQLPQVRI